MCAGDCCCVTKYWICVNMFYVRGDVMGEVMDDVMGEVMDDVM